jgi:hypothetical protein
LSTNQRKTGWAWTGIWARSWLCHADARQVSDCRADLVLRVSDPIFCGHRPPVSVRVSASQRLAASISEPMANAGLDFAKRYGKELLDQDR